jgi:hypothetical protein
MDALRSVTRWELNQAMQELLAPTTQDGRIAAGCVVFSSVKGKCCCACALQAISTIPALLSSAVWFLGPACQPLTVPGSSLAGW